MRKQTVTRSARSYQPLIARTSSYVVDLSYHGSLLGLDADDHPQYASSAGAGTRSAYSAERLNRTLTAGNGLTGGGSLVGNVSIDLTTPGTLTIASTNNASGNHSHAVTSSSDPQAAASLLASASGGLLTLQSLKMRGDLLPFAPDGANIGSSSYPFLTGHISELYGTRFIEETLQVAGGHWLIPKSSATLASPLNTSATTLSVEAAQAWSVGDWLILREVGQVEYMQITGGSGTSWTVTRNMDGSGANSWSNPTAVGDLGGSAGGWLEAQGGVISTSVWRRTGTSYSNGARSLRCRAISTACLG